MKKYELTQTTINHNGVTLYQIKALRSFGSVTAGELGGFIEKESNLSQEGNAWVSGDARIFQIKDLFTASYVGTENGTLTVFKGKEGLLVTRGCFFGTVDEFLAKSAEVHDEKTKREYQLLIEVAKSRILGE